MYIIIIYVLNKLLWPDAVPFGSGTTFPKNTYWQRNLKSPNDMDLPGLRLHELKGSRKNIWSVSVGGNWRVTFRFIDRDVEVVNYEDYH